MKNKAEVSLQVQKNPSAPHIANNLAELQLKTVDKVNNESVFTVSGLAQKKLVSDGSESGESEESDDGDSDVISDLIGHIGKWQLIWAFILCLFQFPSTFHIFSLVFQVSGTAPKHLCISSEVAISRTFELFYLFYKTASSIDLVLSKDCDCFIF